MNDTAAERVARGVALLDETMPGWHREVDLGMLTMTDCVDCVAGQVAGAGHADSWQAICERIGTDCCSAVAYGFNLADDDGPALWTALESEWEGVIRDRRAADVAARAVSV